MLWIDPHYQFDDEPCNTSADSGGGFPSRSNVVAFPHSPDA
jgi:hypothetical protein